MHTAVVFGFHPGHKQPVKLQQRGRVIDPGGGEVLAAGVGYLDEELFTHAAKPAFDLAPPLGPARCRMHQAHTEFRARPQQPRIDERAAVVHVDPGRNTAGGQRRAQRGGQPHGIFGEAKPIADRQPCVVVEESEQVGLAVPDPRPV